MFSYANSLYKKNEFVITKDAVIFYFFLLAFKIVYEILYINFMYPVFDGAFMQYLMIMYDPNIEKFVISYILFTIMVIFIPKNASKPSSKLLTYFFMINVMPLLSCYWIGNQSNTYTLLYSACFICMCLLLRGNYYLNISLLKIKNTFPIENTLLFLIPIILLVYSVFNSFPNLRLINISDSKNLYDFRSNAVYEGAWGYIRFWLGNSIIPFCIIVFLNKKKYICSFICIIMQIYLFLCTGHKTILFTPIIVIVLYFIFKNRNWRISLPFLYILIISGTCIFYWLTDNSYLMSITPRRELLVPAGLSYRYFDVFSSDPMLYFSETQLGKLLGISSPYETTAGIMIGMGHGNAVTGIFGNAYSNGGFMVMLLYSLAFAIILLFIDAISYKHKNKYIYAAFFIPFIVALSNGGILGVLMTHGGLITIVLAYIYASQNQTLKTVSLF